MLGSNVALMDSETGVSVGLWQWPSSSWSRYPSCCWTDPFLQPVQLSLLKIRSPGVSSVLLKLRQISPETHQTPLRLHVLLCHPGGAAFPVQTDWATCSGNKWNTWCLWPSHENQFPFMGPVCTCCHFDLHQRNHILNGQPEVPWISLKFN